MTAGLLGNDPPDLRRAGEVDPPRRRVRDQLIDDVGRVGRELVIRLTTPAGRPASCQRLDDRARACAGRARTPSRRPCCRTRAGSRPRECRGSPGAFQGAIPTTTPAGARTPIASLPGTSEGITSPTSPYACAAASRSIPAASSTLNIPQPKTPPVSSVTIRGDLLLALHQQVGGLAEQDLAPHRRRAARPLGESGVGGLDRRARILAAGGGRRPNLARPCTGTPDCRSGQTGHRSTCPRSTAVAGTRWSSSSLSLAQVGTGPSVAHARSMPP